MTTNVCSMMSAFVTNLGATSVLGSNVNTNYKVLESSSACCLVVSGLSKQESSITTFGGVRDEKITFMLEGFLKDTGNPNIMIPNVGSFSDLVVTSLESDPTLQGTVDYINDIRAERTVGEAFSVGGHTWFKVDFNVDVIKY